MSKRGVGAAAWAAAWCIGNAGLANAEPGADKLDLVLKRLEAIEASNAKLAKENATLRERLNKMDGKRAPPVTTVAYSPAQ